jgi:membrane-associated phospholipid phosphatase
MESYLNNFFYNLNLLEILDFYCIFYNFFTIPIYLAIALKIVYHNHNNYDLYNKQIKQISQIALSYIAFIIIFTTLKYTVNKTRPMCREDINLFIVVDTLKERCNSSFPSGHTAVSFIFMQIVEIFNKKFITRILLIFNVIIIMLARVSNGYHDIIDVLSGLFLIRLIFLYCELR